MAVSAAHVVVPLGVTLLATPVVAVAARRLGIVDRPGPLKPQAAPVPYLGGVALFAGIAAGLVTERPALLVPGLLALLLGVADDIWDVAPTARLACEGAIGLTVGAVVAPGRPTIAAWIAIAALTVLLINAVNLLDGLDGLASGVCLVSALGFAVALRGEPRAVAVVVAAATGAFLVFNRPPARIYLGDGGAYVLGTMLAMLLASGWQTDQPRSAPLGAVLLVALPVGDASVAILRRARAGRPLLKGDRGHVYDQLVDRGWPAPRASLACVGAQALLSAAGVLAGKLGPAPASVMVAALAGSMLAVAWLGGFVAPTYRSES